MIPPRAQDSIDFHGLKSFLDAFTAFRGSGLVVLLLYSGRATKCYAVSSSSQLLIVALLLGTAGPAHKSPEAWGLKACLQCGHTAFTRRLLAGLPTVWSERSLEASQLFPEKWPSASVHTVFKRAGITTQENRPREYRKGYVCLRESRDLLHHAASLFTHRQDINTSELKVNPALQQLSSFWFPCPRQSVQSLTCALLFVTCVPSLLIY